MEHEGDKTISRILTIFIILLSLIALFMFFFLIPNMIVSEEYITDTITECNDVDGDLMVGDITCYEKIYCSNIWKFLNEDGCKEVLK